MTRYVTWIALLALLLAIAACQDSSTTEGNSATAEAPPSEEAQSSASDTAPASEPEPPRRNIGRLGAQRGLLQKTSMATPGYILYNPLKSATTYLVDLDGQVVHTWETGVGLSGGIYLKDNGNLFRPARDPEAPVFGGGGQGGWFQEFTWDGELVWNYPFATTDYQPHHDTAILPNGNFLAIAWEAKSAEEVIAAGRDAEAIPKAGLWPDWIVELKPNGSNDALIVWEWHLWDHMVQELDETKDNYGVVADHPELLDINVGHLPEPITQEQLDHEKAIDFASTNATVDNRGSDLYHVNAVHYNAELDQIAISAPGVNEIFVIDHSTTTEEAAGHTGGRWGKGGDILYRWGNPSNYGRGDESTTRLGGQHDVRWVPAGYPGESNLLLYNNNVPGAEPAHSAVLELQTPLKESGYELSNSGAFGPEEPSWSYVPEDPMDLFSPFISGAERLANGHTLITEGVSGRFVEVDADGNVVWDYMTPYAGYVTNPDGSSPQPVGPFVYATFRSTHIPPNHPALAGRDLTPLDPQPPAYTPPQD